ncbi:MAG: ferredoxin [Acidimicrobiia bacterium]
MGAIDRPFVEDGRPAGLGSDRSSQVEPSLKVEPRGDVVALSIEINRDVCMGSGNCSFWAPGVFDLDDDGIAIVTDPAGEPEDKIILAAQGCPTQAISVSRDGEKVV